MKKIFGITVVSALAMLMMVFPSFASSAITSVDIYCGPDDDQPYEYSANGTIPLFTSNDVRYSLSYYYDVNPDSTTYRSERTYELILYANSGYYFPDEDEITVTYTGISSVQRKTTEASDTLVIRVKAYPYYKWDTPTFTTSERLFDSSDTSTIRWDGAASRYEVLLTWEDSEGTERSRHTTVTSESLSVSSYNRSSSRVTGIAVRAIGNAGNNTRTAPSDWATMGSIDVNDFDVDEYETWSDIDETATSGTSSATSTTTSSSSSTNTTVGWVQIGDDWYYRNISGAYSTGWIHDGSYWYYMDSAGKMQAGWFYDGTNWYYLNEQHDGTYGRMLTGWQDIGGQRYYLNPNSDGTQGAMLTGLQVIDGVSYYFNEAHDGTYGRLITSL